MQNINDVHHAYRAMISFIEAYLARGNTDVESFLYSYAAPIGDGEPADPAAWHDWLDAIDKTRSKPNF